MKEKTPSYVKIDPPVEFRKAILEGLKSEIHMLQRFEKIQELRHQREQRIQDLVMLEKAISTVMDKVKAKLPAVSAPKLNGDAKQSVPAIAALAKKPQQAGSASKTKVSKKAAQQAKKANIPAPLSLNELEKQLRNIEGKLGKLQ